MTQDHDNPLVFDRKLLAARRARAAAVREADYLFDTAASLMADRLLDLTGRFETGLELGSRHGLLANALLETGRVGQMIHADICLAMLPPRGNGLVLDAEFLPFAHGSLDLIASALDLHWVNDLPGCLLQIRQALRPDGLFLASMLGGETLTELRHCLMLAEDEVCGGVSPRISPFADLQQMAGLMQRAGFALPVVDVDRVTVTFPTAFKLMSDLRAMGETGLSMGRKRSFTPRAVMVRAAELYAEMYREIDPTTQEARIFATFDIIHLSGWAPAATQQKPLKPGSATSRLAEALNTQEMGTGEASAPAMTGKTARDKT